MAKIALLAVVLLVGAFVASSVALVSATEELESWRHLALAPSSLGHPRIDSQSSDTLGTRSFYASQGAVTLTASTTDDDASFSTTVCASLTDNAPVTSLSLAGAATGAYLDLPSCVYNILGTVEVLTLTRLNVNGNATFSDPLALLGPILSTASTAITLTYVNFYGSELNDVANVNWTNFISNHMPALQTFSATRVTFVGALPAFLPASCYSFACSYATFTGTIPSTMLPFNTSSLTLVIQYGNMIGNLPNNFFANVGPNAALSISIGQNSYLNGTIGSNFLAGSNMASLKTLSLILSANTAMTGTIPADLWGLPTNCSVTNLIIDVGYSNISAYSKTFLSSYTFPLLTSFEFRTRYGAIKGDFPSNIMPLSAPKLISYLFYNTQNVMGGTVPTALIGNIASWTGGLSPYTFITLWMQDCQLTGIMTFPAAPTQTLGTGPYTTLKFAGSGNNFTYFNVKPTASRYLTDIEIGSSPGSRGNLDNIFALSTDSSYLDVVDFSDSLVSGTMPDLNNFNVQKIKWLGLANTGIDFCADNSTRSPWTGSSALNTCNLSGTNAYDCPNLYPNCQVSAPAPSAPTSTPSTSSSCSAVTKPSSDFTCVDGIWVNVDSTTTTTLIISSTTTSGTNSSGSTSQVLVLGNVTSSTLMYQSLGTTLVVGGCATNLSTITIELTPADVNLINSTSGGYRQRLLAIQGSGCTDLSNITLSTTLTNSTCTSVGSTTETSEGQLFALFSVTRSGCSPEAEKERRVWIIVVPAVCGAVLLAVILTVIIVVCCSGAKKAVRPYAGADPHRV